MQDTRALLLDTDFPALRRGRLQTLQVNLGYRCNLSCTHCHVNAGPTRTESMTPEVIDLVLAFAHRQGVEALDLTGGAPELHRRPLPRLAALVLVPGLPRGNLAAGGTGRGKWCGCR